MEKLQLYFQYSFVRYALIVGVLVALCSSLLGVTLVLKRLSFIGDGLSHVAFGAMCAASVVGLTDNMLLVMPVTVATAIFLLRPGKKAALKGDAAIAMLSVSSLAIGYLLMNVFATSANVSGDVCSTLFGSMSILTLNKTEVTVCIVLSVAVILTYVLMYNRLFAVTFDEDFAKASGLASERYQLIIAVIIAVIIVLGMNLVGSLLISALVVFPTLSSMRISHTFRGVVILSAILSVVCTIVGMLLSMVYSTPLGATIVGMDILMYMICSVTGRYLRRS